MPIFDIKPQYLCDKHLQAQHRAVHKVWNTLTGIKAVEKPGNSKTLKKLDKETRRWKGRLMALYERHRITAVEMGKRGMSHTKASFLLKPPNDCFYQDSYAKPLFEQMSYLMRAKCECSSLMAKRFKNLKTVREITKILDKVELVFARHKSKYIMAGIGLATTWCSSKQSGLKPHTVSFERLSRAVTGEKVGELKKELALLLSETEYAYVVKAMELAHYITRKKDCTKEGLRNLKTDFMTAILGNVIKI